MELFRPIIVSLVALVVLAGCVRDFPDIPAAVSATSDDAPWPAFLPVAEILDPVAEASTLSAASAAALQRRLKRLRRRAATLNRQ